MFFSIFFNFIWTKNFLYRDQSPKNAMKYTILNTFWKYYQNSDLKTRTWEQHFSKSAQLPTACLCVSELCILHASEAALNAMHDAILPSAGEYHTTRAQAKIKIKKSQCGKKVCSDPFHRKQKDWQRCEHTTKTALRCVYSFIYKSIKYCISKIVSNNQEQEEKVFTFKPKQNVPLCWCDSRENFWETTHWSTLVSKICLILSFMVFPSIKESSDGDCWPLKLALKHCNEQQTRLPQTLTEGNVLRPQLMMKC